MTPSNVTTFKLGNQSFHLIGTAHISEDSVNEVRQVIDAVQPDTVCVELCDTRYKALTEPERWDNLDLFKVIRQGKTLFLLGQIILGAHQRRLGQQVGIKPGAEMMAAIEQAKKVGATIDLIDRDIQITLKRTWGDLSFSKKFQILGLALRSIFTPESITAEDIEKLKEKEQLSNIMDEFAKALPQVKTTLIDERDQYMMAKLQQSSGNTIVAVVGAGHVDGMQRYTDSTIDIEPLQQLPKRSKWAKAIPWIIPSIVIAAFTFGIQKTSGQSAEQLLWAWMLPNSILSALCTALAGGRLLTIGTAFIASPITSLNPLIGAGMVAGLVEAWLRKPTVQDCQRIYTDMQTMSGLYRNRFTRVLWVAIMANIGSALGAWMGLGWILKLVSGH